MVDLHHTRAKHVHDPVLAAHLDEQHNDKTGITSSTKPAHTRLQFSSVSRCLIAASLTNSFYTESYLSEIKAGIHPMGLHRNRKGQGTAIGTVNQKRNSAPGKPKGCTVPFLSSFLRYARQLIYQCNATWHLCIWAS